MEGMNKLLSDLEKIKKNYPNKLNDFVTNQGNKLLAETKKNTPVDTGTLRNAWQTENGYLESTVYNMTDYAEAVEFGTINQKANYMLTKSTKKIENEFVDDFNKVFKGVL